MAGTIIADFIRADANKFSINVGNTIVASVNSLGILSNTGTVLIDSSGQITANNISLGRIVTPSVMPANSVLQVVTTTKTDTFTMSGTTWTTVTGLTASITPTKSTSKILVLVNIYMGHGYYSSAGRLMRDSTPIGIGDTAGSRPRSTFAINGYCGNTTYESYNMWNASVVYLDSPSTINSTTYSIQLMNYSTGYTVGVNRTASWQDTANYDYAPISTITLMEIAQ